MVLVYVHMLTGLCSIAWHVVGIILAQLDCCEMAVVFALMANDFGSSIPFMLLNDYQWLKILKSGDLSYNWQDLDEKSMHEMLKLFKTKLYQDPRLLADLICDKQRLQGRKKILRDDKKISTLPFFDYGHAIVKVAFHPKRPIVAVLYKQLINLSACEQDTYKMIVHAYGGRERKNAGAVLYHSTNNRSASCKAISLTYWMKEHLTDLVWSPTGKYLLSLEKVHASYCDDTSDWEVNLFEWNSKKCTLNRIASEELPLYTNHRVHRNFTSCWSSENSFWIMGKKRDSEATYGSTPEWTKVRIDSSKSNVRILKTEVFTKGVPDLQFANKARSVWLLRRSNSESENLFVWAEKCHDSDHFSHSIVRYRREGSESESDLDVDTQGFIFDKGIVVAGDIDSCDPSCLLLLVLQPSSCSLNFLNVEETDDDDDEKEDSSLDRLRWSKIPAEGLKKIRYPFQAARVKPRHLSCNNNEISYEKHFVTSSFARHKLFLVRISAANPEEPIVVNKISDQFPQSLGHADARWNTFSFVTQSATELMIRDDAIVESTFIVSKLLPFHYHTPVEKFSLFWHPQEAVYISQWDSYEQYSCQVSDDYDDDDDNDNDDDDNDDDDDDDNDYDKSKGLLWKFKKMPSQKRKNSDSFAVTLKHNTRNPNYKKLLEWPTSVLRFKRSCKRGQCQQCRREEERLATLEWSSPIKTKLIKKE